MVTDVRKIKTAELVFVVKMGFVPSVAQMRTVERKSTALYTTVMQIEEFV